MRTRALLPALVATTFLFGGSAAMAATATTIPSKTAAPAAKVTTAKVTTAKVTTAKVTTAKVTTAKVTTAKVTATKSTVAMARVDANTASTSALRKLPGVGPKLAQEIISGRPYKDEAMLQKRLGKYLSTAAAAKLETHLSY